MPNSYKAYKYIKRYFSEYKDRTTVLRGVNNKIITEGKKNVEVWKQYIKKLYRSDNRFRGQWTSKNTTKLQE